MAENKKNNPSMEFPLQIERQYPAPLDKHSLFYSLSYAEEYAKNSPLAYVGQIISVVNEEAEAVKVLKILAGGNLAVVDIPPAYDLVIRTQEEFEAWYDTLDEGTCTAHSVLLVGDGGTLQFTRNDGKGLHLPASLYQLDGMNNAIISVSGLVREDTTNSGAVWYSSLPSDNSHRISNLKVICSSGQSSNVYGFCNCAQLTNCTCTATNVQAPRNVSLGAAAFYNCTQLTNCTGTSSNSNASIDYAYAFYNCTQLTNCTGTGRSTRADRTHGHGCAFYNCAQLTNCTGTGEAYGPDMCPAYGFYNCTQLTNCTGTGRSGGGAGYGFYSCSYSNGCRAGGTSSAAVWGGSNTKRDDDSCDV